MYEVRSGSDFLNLIITNSANKLTSVERRFQKGITVAEFKGKLELLTGANPGRMKLEVFDKNNKMVCLLDNEDNMLGSFPIDDEMRVHVTDPLLGEEDLSGAQKFELTPEDYSKRSDTVKAFLEKNKLGKYNEEEMRKKVEQKRLEDQKEEESAKALNVNDRCEVTVLGQPKRRATIMYVGKTEFKEGWWVGVKYDEPLGKNNGTVNGKQYFECPPKYGGFVKPCFVKPGDFPEEDYDLDMEL